MSAPRIAQPVHYVARGSADGVYKPVCRAAIVTEVPETMPDALWDKEYGEVVAAVVLNPTGFFFHETLEYDEDRAPGTWHYPCVPNGTGPTLKLIEEN